MKISNAIQNVYLIGIGGIGMSALARYFKYLNCQVFGYDRTSTSLTQCLEEEGIIISYDDDSATLPAFIRNDFTIERDLIIYTPAIPRSNRSFTFIMDQKYPIYKRSQVLGAIAANYFTIAIAGTHGKTTTSTLITHVLYQSGLNITAFLGGISNDFKSNLLLPDNTKKGIPILVVEADEFDRSFLTLKPDIAVVTSLDADHLDIYGSHTEMVESYKQFANQIKADGIMISKPELLKELKPVHSKSYSLNDTADYYAEKIKVDNGYYMFDLIAKEETIQHIQCGLAGRHNVENAIAAIAVASQLNLKMDQIRPHISSFRGIHRRFEVFYRSETVIGIDDYAHHPTELKVSLLSAKELYPDKKVYAVFQPHLFSRTRDFMDEFAEVLGLADCIYLLDIYPAREEPIEGITSSVLFEKIQLECKYHVSKEAFLQKVTSIREGVWMILGAGDIDQLVEPVKEIFTKMKK